MMDKPGNVHAEQNQRVDTTVTNEGTIASPIQNKSVAEMSLKEFQAQMGG